MALYKISSSRVNNIQAEDYSGSKVEEGLIWYDPEQGILRLYNGTQGGLIINGSGGTPGGANTQVQFNNNGTFGGSANLTFDSTTGTLGTAAVSATGNISAQYFVGNGSQLTGLPEQYGNANVEAYLPTYTGNLVSLTGNVTTTANISGTYILGNGSQLIGLPEGYSNAKVAAYLPTYTGNLVSLQGNVTTTGNVSGSYIIGNGSLLTGITSTLPTQTGNFGKYLYTDGFTPSWEDVPGVFGLVIDGGNAERASTDFIIDGGGA